MASSERDAAIAGMLERAGWGEAERRPLAGDASTRRYERLSRPGAPDETVVLMDAPPGAERPACPPEATPDERAALGYNALARLAGPNIAAFAGLARELTARGFSAPRVLESDVEHGLLLIEDLGDDLFARAIEKGADPRPLYEAAIDLLGALRRSTLPSAVEEAGRSWPILGYDEVVLQTEADLFTEWYVPDRQGAAPDPGALAEWGAAWAGVWPVLADEPPGIVLRDVHAENLIWLPDREGPARAGLLDFQDALFGHPAYDLVSLLEDARRDVDPGLAEAMIDRFIDVACIDDAQGFRRAYAVLGAQRNAKILGIFVRLAKRDGKPVYLDHLPRVARLFVHDLEHPALAQVEAWARRHAPAVFDEAAA
ncbi:MAG: phosphotransferase [Caulobacterales bacterium]|nr:phosphotransferase [Caulobacterales bacterium]